MTRTERFVAGLLLAVGCLLAGGCGRGGAAASNDLKTLGLMYHEYNDKFKSGPASADDLAKVAGVTGSPDLDKAAVQKVKDGTYGFVWNVSLSQAIAKGSTGDQVLAWESDASTKGGQVLMVDATVRRMTPEEFKAAKKAGQ
jgi:hypothetical protein